MGTHEQDARLMDQAVAEGRKARPSPNPRVGALVARGDEVLGIACHERAGDDHAEIIALRRAGDAAKGATLYCTLEPCNHQGKTPPCVDAIIAAGIARVVVGAKDPNPHVQGGGVERLRAEGIEVTVTSEHRGATDLLAPWAKFITQGIPHVSIKLGLSLDGRIATRTGASRWVTGEEARAKVHELRAERDAVAVGIATAIADDPRLTVRHVTGPNPVRVVFDTQLRLPPEGKLATSAREVETWVVTSIDAPEPAEAVLAGLGVRVLRVPRSAVGRVDVASALRALADADIVSLLVEGGAELVGSMLATQAADELHAFVAPILLGPRGRPGAVDWAGPDTPADAPRIRLPRWELCGEDVYVRGPIDYPAPRLGGPGVPPRVI